MLTSRGLLRDYEIFAKVRLKLYPARRCPGPARRAAGSRAGGRQSPAPPPRTAPRHSSGPRHRAAAAPASSR